MSKSKKEGSNLKLDRHKGKEVITKHATYDEHGKLPLKKNGKISMVDVEEVKQVFAEAKAKSTFDEMQELLARKAKIDTERIAEKRPKAKFITNETGGVDVVLKDAPKEKKVSEVTAEEFARAFEGITQIDTDKLGFVNFRADGKHCDFYIKQRTTFVGLSTRDDSAKSGWKTTRISTRKEMEQAVEILKARIQNQTKYASALIPSYLCPECDYNTTSKTEMISHIGTHTVVVEKTITS